MALFESVTNEPTPWVLPEQRDRVDADGEPKPYEGVQTIFHLRPMSMREWNRYALRRAEGESSKTLAADVRGDKITDIDVEAIRASVAKIENCFKDGDLIESADELGKAVGMLDWVRAQQILFAVRSASALKEGAKKS